MSRSFQIDLDQSSGPLYLQIAAAIRDQILRGELDREPRLPTTRDLSHRLRVNRQTIVAAYRKLVEWGLARSHVGKGTFAVPAAERRLHEGPADSATEPRRGSIPMRPDDPLPSVELLSDPARHGGPASGFPPGAVRSAEELRAPSTSRSAGRGSPPLTRSETGLASGGAAARRRAGAVMPWSGVFSKALDGHAAGALAEAYSVEEAAGTISFAGSFPAVELLPAAEFRRALERALRKDPRHLLTYGAFRGYTPLREWIAEEMSRGGTPASPEEILITNGSQQAIDLVARAFTDPGDLVLLEDPTYTGALSTFQSFGARMAGLPLDAHGLLPGAIGSAAARGGAKLIYTTPTFQNPTSSVLPLDRRRMLLSEAAAANLLVVEDDWAAGLRFEGEELPTLRSLDADSRVIYLSTFAKKALPGLRIGWIAAPRPIIERLAVLKQINDCCTSPLIQAAFTEFLRSGALERHLPKIRAAYRARRDRMIESLERYFPAGCSWTRPEGGLFLWVRLPEPVDGGLVASDAERKGVLASRGEMFHAGAGVRSGGGRGFLRLTFASASPDEIEKGIRILGGIVKKHLSEHAGRRARSAREAVPFV